MVAVGEEGREEGDKKAREFGGRRKYLVEIVSGRDRGTGRRMKIGENVSRLLLQRC